jgi:hypothetical protein
MYCIYEEDAMFPADENCRRNYSARRTAAFIVRGEDILVIIYAAFATASLAL